MEFGQRCLDDHAGDIGRRLEPREIHLVHHGEDDRDAGPQFLTPAQRAFKRARTDRHDDADRPVPILFLRYASGSPRRRRRQNGSDRDFRHRCVTCASAWPPTTSRSPENMVVKRPTQVGLVEHQDRVRAPLLGRHGYRRQQREQCDNESLTQNDPDHRRVTEPTSGNLASAAAGENYPT